MSFDAIVYKFAEAGCDAVRATGAIRIANELGCGTSFVNDLLGIYAKDRGAYGFGLFLLIGCTMIAISLIARLFGINTDRDAETVPVASSDIEAAEMLLCPACAEPIRKNARKCKHCGEWLKESEQL